MATDWRAEALEEITSIKPKWARRHGWRPRTVIPTASESGDIAHIDLLVNFRGRKTADRQFLLRLRYGPEYKTEGRHEMFVNPENPDEESLEFWPKNIDAIKVNHSPPAICLEGTVGFHRVLHKERDGRVANINKLLQEIQRCLDGKA